MTFPKGLNMTWRTNTGGESTPVLPVLQLLLSVFLRPVFLLLAVFVLLAVILLSVVILLSLVKSIH